MRIRCVLRRSFDLPIILGTTLLFMPLGVHVVGAEHVQLHVGSNSGSGRNLAQASVEQLEAEKRKRYEAAAERARAALEAEKSARVNEAPPRIPGNTTSDVKGVVCIAGC
jgi:hypothetical protein